MKQFTAVILSEVGDSITVSFDLWSTVSTTQTLQVGLFDVGSKITGNIYAPAATTPNPVFEKTGYAYSQAFTLNTATYAVKNGPNNVTGKTGSSGAITGAALSASTDHHIEFTLTMTDTGLKLSTIFDTKPMSDYTVESVAGSSVRVDTLWLYTGGLPNGTQVNFDNITLTTNVSVVPEPATAAMLTGISMLILALAASFRHRRFSAR